MVLYINKLWGQDFRGLLLEYEREFRIRKKYNKQTDTQRTHTQTESSNTEATLSLYRWNTGLSGPIMMECDILIEKISIV